MKLTSMKTNKYVKTSSMRGLLMIFNGSQGG